MIYFLDFRGKDVGGPVLPGKIVRIAGVDSGSEDALRRETRVTFLVHGFNVNRPDGQASMTRLAGLLQSQSGGAIVAVTWPGDHWAKFASYSFEGNDADDSGAELVRFIDRVITPGADLSFVSHSLGARVVMESVKRLTSGGFAVRQICMMAAAIDDFSLAHPNDYRAAALAADRVAVLASRNDKVLRFAYPVGDFLQAFLFWRDKRGSALGYHGPRMAREHAIPGCVLHFQISDSARADHGDYFTPAKPSAKPSSNQLAAARFADAVLGGSANPVYE